LHAYHATLLVGLRKSIHFHLQQRYVDDREPGMLSKYVYLFNHNDQILPPTPEMPTDYDNNCILYVFLWFLF
jgi:hypothetical protein